MDEINGTNTNDVGIGDEERTRLFVTMNATFKDEPTCRTAMETIVANAHAAGDVTSHFWFRSDDGMSLFVVEQYENERALRKAVMRFTSARVSFFRSISVTNVSIHGDVSFLIKLAFAALRPTRMGYFGGYSKAVAETTTPGIKHVERQRVFVATNARSGDDARTRRAMEVAVDDTYRDAGTRSHFWTSNNDGHLFVLEQFADEQALHHHLTANEAARAAFLEAIEVGDVTVYGVESDETRALLAPLHPSHMSYYGGYSK